MEKLSEKNHECCFMKPLTIVAIVLSSISILLSVFTLGSGMGRHRNDFHMQRPYGVQSEMRENYPNNRRSGINTPSNNGPTVSPSISPTTAPW